MKRWRMIVLHVIMFQRDVKLYSYSDLIDNNEFMICVEFQCAAWNLLLGTLELIPPHFNGNTVEMQLLNVAKSIILHSL